MDRAPFLTIIGPETEITAGEAQKDFTAFYNSFFQNLDGDTAMNALNGGVERQDRKYHFLSAQRLFSRAYCTYYKSHCIGKGRRERIEALVTEAMKNPDVKRKGITWLRNKIKAGLAVKDEHFEKLKNRYFFCDCFPENVSRFPLNRDEIIKNSTP